MHSLGRHLKISSNKINYHPHRPSNILEDRLILRRPMLNHMLLLHNPYINNSRLPSSNPMHIKVIKIP
jgi:hypothetical protein